MTDSTPTPADDVLEGVDAIATYMGWPTRRVYAVREAGSGCPVRKRRGVGIYALKSELQAWLTAPETLAHQDAA